LAKTDNEFVADLKQSDSDANEFVAIQQKLGWDIRLQPLQIRPNYGSRQQYADKGDIQITARIEHKRRTDLYFTNRETYKYDTVIVDEKYKVDKYQNLPLMYIIQNAHKTHVAIVYAWTRPHWRTITKYDAKQKRDCEFYVVDKQHVRFCEAHRAFGP